MKLKEKLAYEKEMKEHYQEERDLFRDAYLKYKELFDKCIGELKYEKLNVKMLYSIIDEVKILSNDELIKAVIENGLNRNELDKLIHAKLLFSDKDYNEDNKDVESPDMNENQTDDNEGLNK